MLANSVNGTEVVLMARKCHMSERHTVPRLREQIVNAQSLEWEVEKTSSMSGLSTLSFFYANLPLPTRSKGAIYLAPLKRRLPPGKPKKSAKCRYNS